MKQPIRHLLRILLRLLGLWAIDTIAMFIIIALLPGMSVTGASAGVVAAAAALLLAVINLFLRPVILLLALPLGSFVTFGVGLLVNALAFLLIARVLPAFQIGGLWQALIAGLIFSFINTIITGVISVDDEDSFYQDVVERLAARQSFKEKDLSTRGLVMMEIDGLSYHHIQKALAGGYMPTLKNMIDEEGYVLSRIDCGLPSQTSACQAGIMFGDNYDIPAFRWYDKDQQKLFVSGKDAALLDARYAKGNGLMRGGSSINNMLAGDAEKSILTASNFMTGTPEEKKRRAEDIYLLALNPYFLMRVIVLSLGDVILEIWQGWRQRAKKVEPRLDRLHKFYPFVRASMAVLMRDVSSYLMTLDIVRGSPSIYLTWPGYDEVAHHSGPWTTDAFKTLRQYDRVIGRIKDIIERKAPRPYDLLILSDHGQSFGHTFKQRYGYSLKDFVKRYVPEGTTIGHTTGGDDGTLQLASLARELQNVQEQGVGGAVGRAIVKQAGKYADRATTAQLAAGELTAPVSITVCGSGNLGQIYFDLYPRRIRQNELDQAYPGLIDGLAQHEGIGLVVVADESGVPIALGKQGQRNLHTDAVTGDDPLKMYGDPDLRARQVRRVADFPHVGDIMVLSTVYPDGTVAAMEELIGNHGGMGGEQTDAFLFHPDDMPVPATTNSADVFAILNARRGTPAAEIPPKKVVVTPPVDA
ncbi:MAG TPA: phage holin family protein [Anaerolineae bacterium]|nr:phage holin family protein [Anaerolineae bacterium]